MQLYQSLVNDWVFPELCRYLTTNIHCLYRTVVNEVLIYSAMEPPKKRPRPASFKIEIPGYDAMKTRFLLKLQEVRHHLTSQLNQPLSNWDIMNNVFDFWREKHTASRAAPHTPDHVITKDACNQKLMVVAQSSLEKFQEITEKHSRSCSKKLHITKVVTQCHTSFVTLTLLNTITMD